MPEELVYINGDFVPREEARISVFDHGLLYGYGLFETMRAYNGTIFLLDEHMSRLRYGAEAIGLQERTAGIDIAGACRRTLEANLLLNARVRLTLTGGDAPVFPWEAPEGEPSLIISARSFDGIAPEIYNHGYRASIVSLRRDEESLLTRIKSIDYLVTVMARREAAAAGMDESILLNREGFIAEGGNSNIIFVRDGALVTPSLRAGILPGIIRRLVLELAGASCIPVREENILPSTLDDYDEAFFTSSVIEVMPLVAVRDETGIMNTIGNGKPGPVTRKLMKAYSARVAGDTLSVR